MARFLIGLLTGVALVFLAIGLFFFLLLRFQSRPPEIQDNSVLVMRLQGDIPEKPPLELPALLGQGQGGVTVANVWMSFRKAELDSHIKAIVLEPEGLTTGWGKLEELRAGVERFRKSGKPVYALLRSPGAREYYVALAANRIYLGPQEPLMLKGLRLEEFFFKDALNKLGVNVEVEHAGKYKDFGDMFTRTNMGPETREVLNSIVDDLYGTLVARIATARGKTPDQVRGLIDQGPFTASRALQAGLVDALRFEDQVFGELQTQLKVGTLRKVALGQYVRVPPSSVGLQGKSKIALVEAAGDIVRGNPGDDGSGESSLTSFGFDRVLNRVANDSSIKAVVVRIDSPGGEVAASDEIWRQMNLLSRKKPMVISMSDTAASGGYYIAMTGAPILAYPGTLTGSIGVVFGKPVVRGLTNKLGVSEDAILRGKNADIDSVFTPLTPDQQNLLRQSIDETYHDFVAKVAAARHRPFAEIEPVAQGRVWLGSQALSRGLVDQLGGLDAAFDLVKKKAGIPASEHVTIETYPEPESLLDVLLKRSSGEEAFESKLASIFGRAPFHAWMRGGYLRLMPYWVEVR